LLPTLPDPKRLHVIIVAKLIEGDAVQAVSEFVFPTNRVP
jgi:hypothetical protein